MCASRAETPSVRRHLGPGVLCEVVWRAPLERYCRMGTQLWPTDGAGPRLHPRSPWAATLRTVFRQRDRDAFEAPLGAWADEVVESLPTGSERPTPAIALEGKTLRGSKRRRAVGELPSHYRRWRSSELHWKTE